MHAVSPDQFRDAMASFASSVTVVTSLEGSAPVGMTATAFSSLSLEPPLCLVCVHHDASCLAAVQGSGVFAVNMLAAGQEALSMRFASPVPNRFEGVAFQPGQRTGCALLLGAIAHVECRLHSSLPGGDHTILVGEVVGAVIHDAPPLLYWRGAYRSLMG